MMIDNKLIVIDQDLRKAYELANYKLFDPPILFKIRQKSDLLMNLLDKHHTHQAFFISAYNPASKLLTEEENKLRHHQLQNKLLSFGGIIYEGIGVGSRFPKLEKSLGNLLPTLLHQI